MSASLRRLRTCAHALIRKFTFVVQCRREAGLTDILA